MEKTADAVIIGGGIMGASIGHFLAKRKFGKVVLLEQRTLAAVSTGASAANVRTYYSNPVTVQLAKRAVEMFENDKEELGGDCGFRQIGFLLLLDEGWKVAGDQILRTEISNGVEVKEVSRGDIAELAPQLSLDGVVGGIFEPRSGYTDPVRTTQSLVNRAKDWGLVAYEGVGATALRLQNSRVVGVETKQGTLETGLVVNAAGPWGGEVGTWASLKYSLRWSRESDLVMQLPANFGRLPVVSDPTLRFYFRPHDNDKLLAGLGFPKEIEPLDINNYDRNLDLKTRRRIEQSLFQRLPALESAEYHHGYASIYTITDDWHPIVGPEPDLEGYYAFFGGSGHGYKLAPPIGESLADIITGKTPKIDIHAFRPTRFLEGQPFSSAWGGGNRG
ncbi:MAG: FAD-binding oxidoreductase [Acidobacteria bacterium]|nr:FAD-binding oxidoreductase [Acidobacteriota bacterium]MCI0722308.1 FAD-binding oxidoreductase [Acidobacteriota bacterium]